VPFTFLRPAHINFPFTRFLTFDASYKEVGDYKSLSGSPPWRRRSKSRGSSTHAKTALSLAAARESCGALKGSTFAECQVDRHGDGGGGEEAKSGVATHGIGEASGGEGDVGDREGRTVVADGWGEQPRWLTIR
jgi:hypothetical protein